MLQVIAVLCSVGGIVLVAVFSQQDGAQNSTSSSNFTDNSSGSQIHETPLGYVVRSRICGDFDSPHACIAIRKQEEIIFVVYLRQTHEYLHQAAFIPLYGSS